VVSRGPCIAAVAVILGTIVGGCSQGPSGLPVTISGHSRAVASDVRCSPPYEGVVTISGILTGTATTPAYTGVAVTATVYWAKGARDEGIWPPVSLRKGQSKGFRMPVGAALPVIRSGNPNRDPVASLPRSFPKAVRCSVRLENFKVVDLATG
jgi:hypothetical protein